MYVVCGDFQFVLSMDCEFVVGAISCGLRYVPSYSLCSVQISVLCCVPIFRLCYLRSSGAGSPLRGSLLASLAWQGLLPSVPSLVAQLDGTHMAVCMAVSCARFGFRYRFCSSETLTFWVH